MTDISVCLKERYCAAKSQILEKNSRVPLFTCLCMKRTGNIEEQNVVFLHLLSLPFIVENGYAAVSCPTTGSSNRLSWSGEGWLVLRKTGSMPLALLFIAGQ
jgi:hypothetical protein